MSEFRPTKHLLEKMAARNVSWGEIIDVLEHPEVTFGPDHKGLKTVQKGDLAVIVSHDGAVITVLLREIEKWTDEQAQQRGEAAQRGLAYRQDRTD